MQKNGRISHFLFPEEILKSELGNILNDMRTEGLGPIFGANDFEQYYDLLGSATFIRENALISALKIPLINFQQAMHIKAVPHELQASLGYEYILTSRDRTEYATLNKHNLEECQSLKHGLLCHCRVCRIHKEIQEEDFPSPPIAEIDHNIFEYTEVNTIANKVCGNQTSSVALNGTGLIKLPDNCALFTSAFSIRARGSKVISDRDVSFNITLYNTTKSSLEKSVFKDEIGKEHDEEVELVKERIDEVNDSFNATLSKVEEALQRLNETEEELRKAKEYQKSANASSLTVSISAVGIAIVIGVALCMGMVYICNRKTVTYVHKNIGE